MEITMELVKELRAKSGAGILDARNALNANGGDIDRSMEYLRQKGILSSERRSEKVASEGLVTSYIHNNKIGVMVEVNCETDFVARTPEFQNLVKDICLHIASNAPKFLNKEEIPQSVIDMETRIEMGKDDLAKKPENIRSKIVTGRVEKIMKQRVLLEQPFVKDSTKTIDVLVKEASGKFGEKITIRRFVRFVLGEGMEKKTDTYLNATINQMMVDGTQELNYK